MLKEDKNVKLIMIGDGPLHSQIEEKVKDLNLEKHVIYVKQTNVVEKYMQAIDVLVMPSRFEGFPMVLVEAMSANLPCVVSSNISREVDIVGLVKFVEDNEEKYINDGNKNNVSLCRQKICNEYKRKILDFMSYDRESTASDISTLIKEQGYNMEDNSSELKKIYEDRLSRV